MSSKLSLLHEVDNLLGPDHSLKRFVIENREHEPDFVQFLREVYASSPSALAGIRINKLGFILYPQNPEFY